MSRSALGLAAASALLYSASFPPLEIAPLAWLALAPLLVAASRASPASATGLGIVWGYLVCLLVGWPFGPMLAAHLDLPLWYGWLAFVFAAPALIGAYVAAFCAWLSWTARRRRATPLFVAAAWVVIEFARHHFSAGIPWALSGYTQMPWLTVAQAADLAGPFGIAFILGGVNAQLASLVAPNLRPQRPLASAVALACALAALWAYGTMRLGETPDGRTVGVALVQGGFAPGHGTRLTATEKLDRYLALSEEATIDQPELIVWPEFALDFVPTRASLDSLRLRELTELSFAELLTGGPAIETNVTGEEFTHRNSVYLASGGRITERYDKERPLPVAEQDVLGLREYLEVASYEPGERSGVIQTNAGRIGVAICSEAMRPALVRRRVRDGAELLLNPSNDSWFGAEPAVRHQLRIASMRAIESRRFLVRPTPTGYSAVIDPWGRTVARSALDGPEVLAADVVLTDRVTPYARYGDVLPWVCLALAALAALLPARRTG